MDIQNSPVTLIILAVTVITSLAAFNNAKLMGDLIFDPVRVNRNRQYYRFFSSGLIHADAMHLIFNMVSLYMFGPFVENAFVQIFDGGLGHFLYLLMYVAALPICLLPTYNKNKNNPYYLGLGASGAVSAVVFAVLLLAPTIKVGLFIIPPIIPGFIFGPIYLAISAWLDKQGKDNINHSAHIWGALFGLVFVIVACYALANFNVLKWCIQQIKWFLQGGS